MARGRGDTLLVVWGDFCDGGVGVKFGHPPARCARVPLRCAKGGRYCGEFRASAACCAWLARVFFAERRGGQAPTVSVARVDVRCHARIVLRSPQAWG